MNSISRCQPLLGTYVEITLKADLSEDNLLKLSTAAFNEIERVHNLMSFHDPDSELSRINRLAYQQTVSISADMQTIFAKALDLSNQSAGLFDISIASHLVQLGILPDHHIRVAPSVSWRNIKLEAKTIRFDKPLICDLGGIAKGYAVDQVFKLFAEQLATAGFQLTVNAGGDLRLSHWQNVTIAIRNPANASTATTLVMQAPAVATSANYFLDTASDMVDPASGELITSKLSYSVFAADCMLADALTKLAFLNNNRPTCSSAGQPALSSVLKPARAPDATLVSALGGQAFCIDANNIISCL
ncbi:MAG: FAD:protein FMN transferase [Pseudomonadales bacterium]|nr:FAD:protein FMN transferase [Pseudomonadales bacterium]